MSPRSTAATASFQFTSFSADRAVIDTQMKGLVAKAENIRYFDDVELVSSSQIVAESDVTFIM